MKQTSSMRGAILILSGALAGGAIGHYAFPSRPRASVAPASTESAAQTELVSVKADIAKLKGATPSQSHAMADVGYHFANLWFAGTKQNWDLATFCFDETRSHIKWAIRIIPVRKDPAGNPVDLQGIFDGIDTSLFAQVKAAIDGRNREKFVIAYKNTLDGCYACHKSAGKPFLRLTIPTAPAQPILNYQPEAEARSQK
ncbi:MAG TPA: hypothetical protein VGX46_08855 [Vicinamibacterales bacterium]|nr:hypothetical protein [Vicinamibacterales bacterium]